MNFVVWALLVLNVFIPLFAKPLSRNEASIEYVRNPDWTAPVLLHQEPTYFDDVITHPQRTEALINNTLVAGNMIFRFLRAIYRAGTIVYSYMPPVPSPFSG